MKHTGQTRIECEATVLLLLPPPLLLQLPLLLVVTRVITVFIVYIYNKNALIHNVN